MNPLPFVTAIALAVIQLASTKYNLGIPRQGTLGLALWMAVAGSIAIAAVQTRRRPALWGLVTGASAGSGAALLGLALRTSAYNNPRTVLTLFVIVLCGATAAIGRRQSWRWSPLAVTGISRLWCASSALMVVGLVTPGSSGSGVGFGFGEWHGTNHVAGTLAAVIQLSVFAGCALFGAALRTQWGRWLATGAGAPVVLNVLTNLASRDGASFYLIERADPSLVLVIASFCFCGLAMATFATAQEVVIDRAPSHPSAAIAGRSLAALHNSSAVAVGPPLVFASFGARAGAFVIDSLVNTAFVLPGYALIYGGISGGGGSVTIIGLVLALVGSIAYPVIYCAQVGRLGQSWGHRAVGVRVVDAATGAPIGGARAFGRLLLRALAAVPCYLGLLWVLWDRKRRGWHDIGVGSVVVPVSVSWGCTTNGQPVADHLPPAPPPEPAHRSRAGSAQQTPLPLEPLLISQRDPDPMVAPLIPMVSSAPPPPERMQWSPFAPPPDTTIVSRTTLDAFEAITLRFDDGSQLALDRVVLIGRDPAPVAGDLGAFLVSLPDPTMSVSKTHLALGVDRNGAWVEDRHSTNGVVVDHGDGEPVRVGIGRRARVPAGARVEFGDRWIEVSSG